MTKPITPDEVPSLKKAALPPEVLVAVNTLIVKHYSSGFATFTQNELLDLIVELTGESRSEVFDNRWLDVEDVYRDAGWDVDYDKPGYNETYAATFTLARCRT